MSANAGDQGRTMSIAAGNDVMAAVDRSGDGPTFVIADVSVDDAWLAVPEAEAIDPALWR